MKPRLAWLVIGFVAGVAVTGGAWAGDLFGDWHGQQLTALVERLECRTEWIGLRPGWSIGDRREGKGHGLTRCRILP